MAKIILFRDYNFEGTSKVITDSTSSLPNFDNTVSSVIVISGRWKLYPDNNYEGKAFEVSDDGGPTNDGCYGAPGDLDPLQNDTLSSLKLVGNNKGKPNNSGHSTDA